MACLSNLTRKLINTDDHLKEFGGSDVSLVDGNILAEITRPRIGPSFSFLVERKHSILGQTNCVDNTNQP